MKSTRALFQLAVNQIITFSVVAAVAAPGQGQLPSQSYDDYDIEKYQQLVQKERRQLRPLQEEAKDLREQKERLEKRVNQLQQSIQQLQTEIQRLEQQLAENKLKQDQSGQQQADLPATIQRLKNEIQEKRSQLAQLSSRIAELEREQGPASGEIASLQSEIATLESQLSQIEQNVGNTNSAIATAEQKLNRLEEQITRLKAGESGGGRPERGERPGRGERGGGDREARLAKLEQEKVETAAELDQLKTKIQKQQQNQQRVSQQINQKKSRLAQLQSQTGGSAAQLTQLKNQETQIKNQIQNLERQWAAAEGQSNQTGSSLEQLKAEEARLRQALQAKQQQLANQTQALNGVKPQLGNVTAKLQALQPRLQQQKAELDKAQVRLTAVEQNVEKAREILSRIGSRHGAEDGERNGANEGTFVGAAAGQEDGFNYGRQDGLDESIRIARANGDADGVRMGTETGHRDGSRQGTIDGEREGQSQGQAAGLKQAYKDGYGKGYQDGSNTGRDESAYFIGQERGRAQGLMDAMEEAKPLERKAYQAVEATYLGAALKKVSLGDELVSRDFDGLQQRKNKGRKGERRKARNNRGGHGPREGRLPHPRLKAFYQNAYDQAFDQSFGNAYERAYDFAYERASNQAYDRAYEQFVNTSQSGEYKDAYDRAYSQSYNESYRSRYNTVYAREKDIAYDKAFALARQDQQQIADGFAEGLRIGSQDKGFKDGRADAYAKNIESEKQKATDRGTQAAHSLYMNNAVLKFVSVDWMDQDGDGFFRPGETIDLMFRLKNFGLKSATELSEKYSGIQNLQTTLADQNSGEIPAQSEVTILRRARLMIAAGTKDQSQIGLNFELVNGSQLLGQRKFSTKARYPVDLLVENTSGRMEPGASRKATIKLKNRSATLQKVNLMVALDKEILQTSLRESTALELKANEARTIALPLKALESGFLLSSPIEVKVLKGEKLWAQTHQAGISVVKKYSTGSASRSLVISSGQTPRGTARLFQSGKADVWDFRVDSNKIGSKTIGKYKGKIIQIMGDSGLNLTDDAIAALKSHYRNAGSLIVWGSDLRSSKDLEELLATYNIQVDPAQSFDGQLKGTGAFSDLNPKVSGFVSPVSIKSVLGAGLLKADGTNVMMMTLTGATKSQYGRLFVVGTSPDALGAAMVKKIVDRVAALSAGWDKKLNAAKTNAEGLRLVMSDIRDEVALAEADSSWIYYKEFGRNNRIQRLIEQVLFSSSVSAQVKTALAKYYPYVHGLVAGLGSEKPFAEKVLLIKSSSSSRSWKQQYCDKFKTDEGEKETVARLCK